MSLPTYSTCRSPVRYRPKRVYDQGDTTKSRRVGPACAGRGGNPTLVDAILAAPAVGGLCGPRRSSVLTVPRPVPWRSELDPIVIWLSGQRDIATDGALRLAVADAMASGAALAMEPSGVELISVSTLETIARAREPLWHRSRSLTVRSPSASVRRIIDSYGLTDLCPAPGGQLAKSLSPWVAVPAPGGPSAACSVAPLPPSPTRWTTILRAPAPSADRREEAT